MQSAHIQGLTPASCLRTQGGPWGLESASPQASLGAQTASGAQGWSQIGAGEGITRRGPSRSRSRPYTGSVPVGCDSGLVLPWKAGSLVRFPTNCLPLSKIKLRIVPGRDRAPHFGVPRGGLWMLEKPPSQQWKPDLDPGSSMTMFLGTTHEVQSGLGAAK